VTDTPAQDEAPNEVRNGGGMTERSIEFTSSTTGAAARVPRGQILGAIVLLAIVAFGIPVALAHKYGALGAVRNDDWSYLLTLFRWVDSGHLDFNNWVSMTLLAQLVIAAPIVMIWGHDITLVQLLTATLGLVGLVAVLQFGYVVTRRFRTAVFVAVLVAAGPLWGALAVSFMTDVPAFAVSMAACGLFIRAIRTPRISLPYLVASMAAGLIGFTIRQYAAVPLVAILIVGGILLWQEGSRPRLRVFIGATVLVLVGAIVFYAFWRSIPHPKAFTPAFPTGHSIHATVNKGGGLLRLLGLLVAPALVLAGPGRIIRRSWSVARDTTVFIFAGVVGGLTLTAFAGPNIGFAGNYIVPDGILAQGVAAGHRPDLLPGGVFDTLLIIGTLGAGLLAIAIVPFLHDMAGRVRTRDFVPRDPLTAFLGFVAGGYALSYFLAAFTGIALYDRYVLPAVPIVALLLLRDSAYEPKPVPARRGRRSPWRTATALATLAALGVLGLVYTADSASFDGVRWTVATEATHAGWTPNQITGGFEWTNFYGFHSANRRTEKAIRRAQSCVLVIVNPPTIDGSRVVASGFYRPPFHEAVRVIAQRSQRPCTPANPQPAKS
jgi:hypothetical protein